MSHFRTSSDPPHYTNSWPAVHSKEMLDWYLLQSDCVLADFWPFKTFDILMASVNWNQRAVLAHGISQAGRTRMCVSRTWFQVEVKTHTPAFITKRYHAFRRHPQKPSFHISPTGIAGLRKRRNIESTVITMQILTWNAFSTNGIVIFLARAIIFVFGTGSSWEITCVESFVRVD